MSYNILDLFAGAGGFGLGFLLASEKFNLICSLEIDQWAVETLRINNHSNQLIIQRDIREFDTAEKILNCIKEKPDVIVGGPPCQGFSNAGPIKDPKDPRNSLFKNFAQWVDVLHPRIFVMENVSGLLRRKNESGQKVIDIILETFESIGYKTTIWKLNAAHFGVPQNRERIFLVGNNIGEVLPVPNRTHYLPAEKKKLNGSASNLKPAIKVIKALSDLPKLKAGEGFEETPFISKPRSDYQKEVRMHSKLLYNHVSMSHTSRVVLRFEEILKGVELDELPVQLQVRKRNGNGELSSCEYNSNYRHLKPQMVSYTIPASFYSNFIHPNQPRNITAREAARLQSFPDSYIFKGKRTQISSKLLKQLGKDHENHLSQYNQIGNAVPPKLAQVIANSVLQFLSRTEKYNIDINDPRL